MLYSECLSTQVAFSYVMSEDQKSQGETHLPTIVHSKGMPLFLIFLSDVGGAENIFLRSEIPYIWGHVNLPLLRWHIWKSNRSVATALLNLWWLSRPQLSAFYKGHTDKLNTNIIGITNNLRLLKWQQSSLSTGRQFFSISCLSRSKWEVSEALLGSFHHKSSYTEASG